MPAINWAPYWGAFRGLPSFVGKSSVYQRLPGLRIAPDLALVAPNH